MRKASVVVVVSATIAGVALGAVAQMQQEPMTFFITSVGLGKGADLGGLAGADRHCQSLAEAAGAGKRTWRAYLSTTVAGGGQEVHARDRIGKGPWQNAKGTTIARDVEQLHTMNNINRLHALTEKGEQVNGGAGADTPNMHDILTGSSADGRALPGAIDTTCGNWTKSAEGTAIVGHHNRLELTIDDAARSWNFSHPSRGCSQDNLRGTGGAGLLYCFAAR